MNLGKNLVRILGERGITQRKLASEVGATEMFISYVVNGYKCPSLTLTLKIADFLKVSLDELVK